MKLNTLFTWKVSMYVKNWSTCNILKSPVYHARNDIEKIVEVSNKKCVFIHVTSMVQQLRKVWHGSLTYATAEVVASHMFTLMTCAYTFWRILNARKERMWVSVQFFLLEHMLNDLIDYLILETPCFTRWQCDWNSFYRTMYSFANTGNCLGCSILGLRYL